VAAGSSAGVLGALVVIGRLVSTLRAWYRSSHRPEESDMVRVFGSA